MDHLLTVGPLLCIERPTRPIEATDLTTNNAGDVLCPRLCPLLQMEHFR